jgi:hypothetical protein
MRLDITWKEETKLVPIQTMTREFHLTLDEHEAELMMIVCGRIGGGVKDDHTKSDAALFNDIFFRLYDEGVVTESLKLLDPNRSVPNTIYFKD